MAQQIGTILDSEDEEAIEKYGPLSGTEKQLRVVRLALEHPDWEPDDVTEELGGTGDGYVRNVLRRAGADIIEQARGEGEQEAEANESPEPDESAEADEEEGEGADPVESPEFDREEAEPTAVWHGGDIGQLAEVSALEWCDECHERHPVIYLLPASEIRYLKEPECGHGGRYQEAEEGPDERVERVIDAIRRRVVA